MSGWTKTATLQAVTAATNAEGVPIEAVESESDVFANLMHMGAQTRFAAKSAGLKANATIQVRSCDYSGENRCVMDSVEYEIEDAYDTGEYTSLTLKRRLRNA